MRLEGAVALKLGAQKGSDSALSNVRKCMQNRRFAVYSIVQIRYQPKEVLGRRQRPSSLLVSAAHERPEAEMECERPIKSNRHVRTMENNIGSDRGRNSDNGQRNSSRDSYRP